MFAIFGLGWGEIIVLAIIGVLIVGVPLIAILVVTMATRQSRGSRPSNELERLRAENEELREEIARLKGGSTGIKAP